MIKFLEKSILVISLMLMPACVETVVVGTIVGGVAVVNMNDQEHQHKKVNQKDEDYKKQQEAEKNTKKTIKKLFKIDNDSKEYSNINILVFKDRILLTGYVNSTKYKKIALDRILTIEKNHKILDEIIVLNSDKKISGFNDYMILKRVSVRLKKIENFNPNNFRYDAVNSVVFIMGSADSKAQMDKITNTISRTLGVKKVINYIRY